MKRILKAQDELWKMAAKYAKRLGITSQSIIGRTPQDQYYFIKGAKGNREE